MNVQEFTDVTAGVGYRFDQHTEMQNKLSSAVLLCLSNPYSAARFMLSHNTNIPTTHAASHHGSLLLGSNGKYNQLHICTIYLRAHDTLDYYLLAAQQVRYVVSMRHVFKGRKYRNDVGVMAD